MGERRGSNLVLRRTQAHIRSSCLLNLTLSCSLLCPLLTFRRIQVSLYVTTRDVYGNLCSTDDAPAASGEEVGTGRDGNIEVQVVGGEGPAMEVSSVGAGLY